MNREQIVNSRAYQKTQAALDYYNEHHSEKDLDLTDAFEAGVEWADENSNKDLVNINDVCKWIEDNIWDFPWYDPDKPLSADDIIKELRRDLEK